MHPITRTTTLRKTTAGGKYNKIERQYLVHGHAGLLPVMPESQDDDLRASACALAWDFGFAVRGNGGRGVRGGHTGRRGGRGARWEVPVLAPSGQQGAGGVARPVLLAENRLIHCPACAEVGERVRHPPLVLPCARLTPWPPCARLLRSDAVEKRAASGARPLATPGMLSLLGQNLVGVNWCWCQQPVRYGVFDRHSARLGERSPRKRFPNRTNANYSRYNHDSGLFGLG